MKKLLFLIALLPLFAACSDDSSEGQPVIERVRLTNPEKADSAFTEGHLGQMILIEGQNLGNAQNIYINNQRINHFVSRCRELSAAGQDIPIQQLALESGFGSYRTFSRAFLQRTGQSVTEWLNGGGNI